MANSDTDIDVRWRCAWGIMLLTLSLFIGLSLGSYSSGDISILQVPTHSPPHNFIGPVGAWLSFGLFLLLGVGAYMVPVWSFAFGLIMLFNREERLWPRALWCAVLMLLLALSVELKPSLWVSTVRELNIPDTGGVLGRYFVRLSLVRWLKVGAVIVMWAGILVSLVFLIELHNLARLGEMIKRLAAAATGYVQEHLEAKQTVRDEQAKDERLREREAKRLEKEERKRERQQRKEEREAEKLQKVEAKRLETEAWRQAADARKQEAEEKKLQAEARRKESEAAKAEQARKAAKETDAAEPAEALGAPPQQSSEPYRLPPLSILDEPKEQKSVQTDTDTTSRVLVETLAEFGIETQVTNVEKGPVVTRYELLPAPGVRVERISGLSNNLALALKATSVRVQAPIPGKGVVGIEVPNTVAKMVFLRDLLEGEKWQNNKAHVPLVIGKDVGGNDIVADLASMPHLLVAGATGAGKTVCTNSILASLLMSRTPDQLRLMLVDPKIVEFAAYNHLPHLVVPVITDPKKVALGLRWAINEMERRYKLFAKVGVRNIASYNSREVVVQEDLFDADAEAETKQEIPRTVPYIVIIIDELADLMLADGAEIENCVARLAQLSRAVGIHMILSTQRPSVNVITGTIKANFPARIAFQVAQKVDSRTILDAVGAEKLLGRGDMLFLPPGSAKVVRAQGAMTTDEEILRITKFIKDQGEPTYEVEIKKKMERPVSKLESGESDELLEQAIEIIRETQRASTSSLQRRMRIGYTRAARMMDILEERGIIGPPRGSDPREILIDLDGEIPQNMAEEVGVSDDADDGTEADREMD